LVDLGERLGTAVEDPHGHVIKAGKHDEIVGLGEPRDATLRDRDIDTGMGIQQQPQVFSGAVGHSLLDRDPNSRQDLDVALRILVGQAILQTRRKHDMAGWGRLKVVSGSPDQGSDQCDYQHSHAQSATARQQCQVFERHERSGIGNDVQVALRKRNRNSCLAELAQNGHAQCILRL